MKDFSVEFSTISLKPGDVIIAKYKNIREAKAENLQHQYNCFRKAFPNNTLLFLPDFIELEKGSKESLINIVKRINSIIADMDNYEDEVD